jgi:hypothetical protein
MPFVGLTAILVCFYPAQTSELATFSKDFILFYDNTVIYYCTKLIITSIFF